MDLREQLTLIKRITALADMGLVYSQDDYKRDRYQEFKEISLQLLSLVSGAPLKSWQEFLMPVKDYPTPKVDIRGFVLNNKSKILMARKVPMANGPFLVVGPILVLSPQKW